MPFEKQPADSAKRAFIYAPQIPLGKARTKGYGQTRSVYVIFCERPENFRTLNSLTEKCVGKWRRWYVGSARFDYGTVRGKSAKLMHEARAFLERVNRQLEKEPAEPVCP